MNNLKSLADDVERLASTIVEGYSPNVQFRIAFRETLCNLQIPFITSHKIAMRMKVNISSFDVNDPDWKRVIDGYGKIMKHVHDIAGSEVVHLLDGFEIEV